MSIYKEYNHSITCIDTGLYRPQLAACYLIEQNGMAAFIDTGTNYSLPNLLGVLEQKKIPVEDVAYVIPTHIHLDHAGGAGRLMQALPNAKLVVHPRGAKHMINPEILQASAISVYGEQAFHQTYGDLIPVPETRVIKADDEYELDLSGRRFLFLDTPGHAYHHFCIYDKLSEGFFTGDTFGLSYREFDSEGDAYILPTTTPIHFDPEAWAASLTKLMSYQPQRMYLTHYGMVEQVNDLVEDLRKRLAFYVDTALAYVDDKNKSEKIKRILTDAALSELEVLGHGLSRDECQNLIAIDMDLNTQGLVHWLDLRR